jgi:hypothetical protein
MKGRELYCVHCWKRTELGEQGADTLQTYSAVLALAKNFTALKIGPGAGGGNKPPDKDRKVINIRTEQSPAVLSTLRGLICGLGMRAVTPYLYNFVAL